MELLHNKNFYSILRKKFLFVIIFLLVIKIAQLNYRIYYNNELNKKNLIFKRKIIDQAWFGNCMASLNNAIFSCEILSCHRIIVESSNCLIINTIHYKERNITIETDKNVNCTKSGVVCISIFFFIVGIKILYLRIDNIFF